MNAPRLLSRWAWAAAVSVLLGLGYGVLRGQAAPEPPVPEEAAKDEDAPAPEEGADKEPKDAKEKREIKVQWGKFRLDNKTGIYTFLPDPVKGVEQVVITEVGEDYAMLADKVVYDERNDTARGTGNLQFIDTDSTIVGDLIVVNFSERLAVVTDNVTLTSHGEETEGDDEEDEDLPLKDRFRKKKTVIECDQIDYWYKEKRAEAHGNLRFRQGDKHGTAGKAMYFEEDDVVLLEGEVSVTNEKGETAKAPTVTIDNKEDTMVADQGGEFTFFLEEDEGEEKGAGKTEPQADETPDAEKPKQGDAKGGEDKKPEAPMEDGAKDAPEKKTDE